MYSVSEKYKQLANAAARNVLVKVNVKGKVVIDPTTGQYTWELRNSYLSTDNVISVKIVEGQTTGSYRLGDTICPVLELKLSSDSTVLIDDLIEVLVSFDNGTEWQLLTSDFFVDSIDRQRQIISVRALGTMILVAKSYNSKLTYPTTESEILTEMLNKNNIGSGYTLLSDATISEKPVKGEAEDGSTLYYTRREMYGYLAAANGGSAYINNANQLCFSTPRETGDTFTHEQVLSETIGSDRVISSIQWNTSGLSYSLGDDYNEDTVEFFNPLKFATNEQILFHLEKTLIGLDFGGAIVKKNGCGYYELGDIVTYTDLNAQNHKLLIMGIVYDFSDGYFSETLYSLTNSKNQRQYAGQEVVSNQIGGGQVQQPTVKGSTLYEYEYISDLSVKYNGVTYTAEKDSTTGLISKISDSSGGKFEPTINSGISDVALHNAVFMAIAMHSGLGSIRLITTGFVGWFTPENIDIDNSVWRNKIAGYNNLSLVGGSVVDNALHLSETEYGEFICTEPNTVYAVLKSLPRGANEGVHLVTKGNSVIDNPSYGFNLLLGDTSDGAYYLYSGATSPYDIVSGVKSDNNYHVFAYTRQGDDVYFYVDNIYVGNVKSYRGKYSGVMYINNAYFGDIQFPPSQNCDIISLAFGTEYHNFATVQNNMTYLKEKYIL